MTTSKLSFEQPCSKYNCQRMLFSHLTISLNNTTGTAALFSNKETKIVLENLRKRDLLLQHQERLVFGFLHLLIAMPNYGILKILKPFQNYKKLHVQFSLVKVRAKKVIFMLCSFKKVTFDSRKLFSIQIRQLK